MGVGSVARERPERAAMRDQAFDVEHAQAVPGEYALHDIQRQV